MIITTKIELSPLLTITDVRFAFVYQHHHMPDLENGLGRVLDSILSWKIHLYIV